MGGRIGHTLCGGLVVKMQKVLCNLHKNEGENLAGEKMVFDKNFIKSAPSYDIILVKRRKAFLKGCTVSMKNNILFFLLPKAMCAFVYDDYTIRQALEKMEAAGYAALPILNRRGEYRGTITEGDLLWALKNLCYMDMRQAEARRIAELDRRKDNIPVRVTTNMHDLVQRASTQNFVPVVDDKDTFIGIVTRSSIIRYCLEHLFPED